MLKVLNLNKSYQVDKTKYEVLKNVSLDMEKGVRRRYGAVWLR